MAIAIARHIGRKCHFTTTFDEFGILLTTTREAVFYKSFKFKTKEVFERPLHWTTQYVNIEKHLFIKDIFVYFIIIDLFIFWTGAVW